ncbi:MAG: ornithine cyclodeaminase family protein [Candidatus Heimdallarchaeota archaeon]|nr:MAG: ornithine cyclodeaminase family protein [Candidatus Heimdallarchaeota archaeon]
MTKIIRLSKIKEILRSIDPLKLIEEGFVAYSQGKVVVPPVGEMIFEEPPGDCHIKYGYIKQGDYYVVKIAQGFYENPQKGLPSINGLNILFSQKTGEVLCVLLDEGHLTNVRTAAAGAVVAKYMSPQKVNRIGILGYGIQGKMQLEYLKTIITCRDAIVWGRKETGLVKYQQDMIDSGFNIETTLDQEDITSTCNLIVTCTPSKVPLIKAEQVRKGTHITAIGSDTPEKQELDPEILRIANHVIVDSIPQAAFRGECFHAMKNGKITKDDMVELGTMISSKTLQRQTDDEITVADLTGVAVQDIQISKAVYEGIL